MNFSKALNKMSKGKHVQSEASKTIYSMDMIGNGKLFAEGIEVKADYITKDEMLGEWIEVKMATDEEARNLSDEAIAISLENAWQKYNYDQSVGR